MVFVVLCVILKILERPNHPHTLNCNWALRRYILVGAGLTSRKNWRRLLAVEESTKVMVNESSVFYTVTYREGCHSFGH